MAQRKGETPPVPLLDGLPAELRSDASPERCVCACCHPEMTEDQRAADRAGQERWGEERRSWLGAHGWTSTDLFWAEVDARRPPERRPLRSARRAVPRPAGDGETG